MTSSIDKIEQSLGEVRQDVGDLKVMMKEQQVLHTNQQALLQKIDTKQDYTNGKVKANTLWRYTVVAGATVFMMTTAPLIMWFYHNYLSEDKIKSIVIEALSIQLSQYEVPQTSEEK